MNPRRIPFRSLALVVGNVMGRPVGVAIDAKGALLVADDVGNVVRRVTAAPPRPL